MTRPADTPCATCGASSVVVVNDRGGCADHIDEAFAVVGEVMEAMRALAEKGRTSSMFVGVSTSYDEPAAKS